MAYIPVNKKTGAAIAKELQDAMETAEAKSEEYKDGKYAYFYGYIGGRIEHIISQLKEGGILIADKK